MQSLIKLGDNVDDGKDKLYDFESSRKQFRRSIETSDRQSIR